MKNFLWLSLGLLIVAACGKEIIYVGQDGKPVDPKECLPKAVAKAGPWASPAFYIAKDPDPMKPTPIPSKVQLGSELPAGLEPRWSPSEGLDNPNIAMPWASPDKDTVYTLTVRSARCGTEASDAASVIVLKEGKPRPDQIEVIIDGKKYPTGYVPSFADKYRAQYVHMGTGRMFGQPLPDELNLRPPGFFVNRQPRGSCWAEGARSAGEGTHYYVNKKQIHASAQDIINCSGFGSAAGGGQISIDRFLPPYGLVSIEVSPYDGYDHKCTTKNGPFFAQVKRTFSVTDKDGDDPEWPDLKAAMVQFGAGEICGSASSLGSGGWVANPGNGGTNHCYATFGYAKGENHGKTAGEYLRVMNSWGAKSSTPNDYWGEDGEGYYRIAPDGIKIRSSVMTENKFMDMGTPCPPPNVDPGPDMTILQIFDKDGNPITPQTVQVGMPALPDQTYQWRVVSGDMDAKIVKPVDAQPMVTPLRTTRLRVEATNKCATAHAEMTIHVWRRNPVTGKNYLVK